MRSNIFKWGGVAASIVLIAFGAGSIAIGAWGINNVRDNLKLEQIVGLAGHDARRDQGRGREGRADERDLSDLRASPARRSTPARKRECFASYMRIHALEATGGQTYAEMGRFLDANGKPTSDESQAAKDPKTGQPVENGLRNLWVTETSLAHRAQRLVLRRARRCVRDRDGNRPAADGDRLPRPDAGRVGAERGCQANGAEACSRSDLSGDSARKQRAAFGPPSRVQGKPAARISAGADFPGGRAANTERNRARSGSHVTEEAHSPARRRSRRGRWGRDRGLGFGAHDRGDRHHSPPDARLPQLGAQQWPLQGGAVRHS